MNWHLQFSKQTLKDAKKLKSASCWKTTGKLLAVLRNNHSQNPPAFENFIVELNGANWRRINIQQRLDYQVKKEEKVVRILGMWTHYE